MKSLLFQKRFLSRYIGPDLLAETCSFPKLKKKSEKGKLIATEGEDVLFGIHPVSLALTSNRRTFHRLFIADKENQALSAIQQLAVKRQVKVEKVSKEALDQAVGNAAWNPHQGVVLDCGKLPATEIGRELDFRQIQGPLVPVLVNIIDPMNIGAILRSAHFFGCKNVVLTSDCSKLSPVVSKASSGAMEILGVHVILPKLLLPFLKWLRRPENKAIVIATTGDEGKEKQDVLQLEEFLSKAGSGEKSSLKNDFFIFFGNEGRGLSNTLVNEADYRVVIPQPTSDPVSNEEKDSIDSLNVSVATGIFLYRCTQLLLRQQVKI